VRSLQETLPGALAELLRGTPLSAGKVGFAWRAAVGPAVGKVTTVRLEGQHLLVDAASTAWAREIERSTPAILRRLQTLLGNDTPTRITVREP
jgi:predicted nucleic acid-binding Zn ribbon protein